VTYAHWAASILANGLGRFADALAASQQASQDSPALYVAMWALPELIEAAARTGNTRIADDALARLAETTQAGGTDFGLGLEAFAERARRELLAAGDTVRRRTVQTASELTDQEAHIAWLAVDGRTNVEIGSQLFLSTRAVEWHLAKVYSKLGVGSRRELRPALAHLQRGDPPA